MRRVDWRKARSYWRRKWDPFSPLISTDTYIPLKQHQRHTHRYDVLAVRPSSCQHFSSHRGSTPKSSLQSSLSFLQSASSSRMSIHKHSTCKKSGDGHIIVKKKSEMSARSGHEIGDPLGRLGSSQRTWQKVSRAKSGQFHNKSNILQLLTMSAPSQ